MNIEEISISSDEAMYEQLFFTYLHQTCLHTDCQTIHDRAEESCGYWPSDDCKNGLKTAVQKYCGFFSFSSLCRSWSFFVIIGAAVAVPLLLIALGVFFYCRRRKKMRKQKQSGMTGTGTQAGSGTATGTGVGTGTGTTGQTNQEYHNLSNFQNDQNTGAATTGGARY